ncbi:MAG: DpnII family type II restriction endonuclease [Candidatus Saccharimonadales bacterium]
MGYFVNWEKFKYKSHRNRAKHADYLISVNRTLMLNSVHLLARTLKSKAIPALLVRDAVNKKKFDILVNYEGGELLYQQFDFQKMRYQPQEIDEFIDFMAKTGLKSLFVDEKIKNLVDYMVGVEAGLDSNGRKTVAVRRWKK